MENPALRDPKVQGPKQEGFRAQIPLMFQDLGPKALSFGSLDP